MEAARARRRGSTDLHAAERRRRLAEEGGHERRQPVHVRAVESLVAIPCHCEDMQPVAVEALGRKAAHELTLAGLAPPAICGVARVPADPRHAEHTRPEGRVADAVERLHLHSAARGHSTFLSESVPSDTAFSRGAREER
eukprot:2401896-Prymnesium_polylepis.2